MSNEIYRRIVYELMRPIVLIGSVLSKVDSFLFGRYHIRASRRSERRFADEIQLNLSFLFTEYNGKIVLDRTIKYPRPFDYASVIVATDGLCWRFFRGRGELRVWVAPETAPNDWEELSSVLDAIEPDTAQCHSIMFLKDAARLLRSHMDLLKKALSPNRYPELKERLAEMHKYERGVARQWETEINRRLYPDR